MSYFAVSYFIVKEYELRRALSTQTNIDDSWNLVTKSNLYKLLLAIMLIQTTVLYTFFIDKKQCIYHIVYA